MLFGLFSWPEELEDVATEDVDEVAEDVVL